MSHVCWHRGLGRTPLGPSGSFRSTFRYGERSLWWWVELWLYYDTELRLHVRDIEALARLLEHETPDRVVVVGDVRQLAKVVRDLAKKSEVQSAVRAVPSIYSSAGCAPQKFDPALIARFRAVMLRCFVMVDPTTPPAS